MQYDYLDNHFDPYYVEISLEIPAYMILNPQNLWDNRELR